MNSPSPPRIARHLSPRGRGGVPKHPSKVVPVNMRSRAKKLRAEQTEAEGLLWWELKAKNLNGYKFSRQVPIGNYIADFVCRSKKLVIEVDGSQHAENAHDMIRTRWLNRNGNSVLRFWNHEVLSSRQMVLSMIVDALEGRLDDAGNEAGWWPVASSPPGGAGNGERCRVKRGGEGAK